MLNSTKFFGVIAVVVAGLVANGGTAFTASSTIDGAAKHVGAVSQTISGITVTDVQYTLGANDTTTAVRFHVAEILTAADTLSATITSAAPATSTAVCVNQPVLVAEVQTSTDVVCSFDGQSVTNVGSLTIVAS